MNLIDKIVWVVVGTLLLPILYLNHYQGSYFYSVITGEEGSYFIGEDCSISRTECEHKYFQNYLDKRASIEGKNRKYFEQIIIAEDQYGYSGNCPCPYDSDSRGGSCGSRSSYSKGGTISYCYGDDISDLTISREKQSRISVINSQLDNSVQKAIDVYKNKMTLYIIIFIYICFFFLCRYETKKSKYIK
jgi:hypothetical protein